MIGVLALVITWAARPGPQIGFAEDATKYADDGGATLFDEMNKLQTTTNRVAVFWNADAPTAIQDQSFLDRMIPVAKAHHIQIVFAIYPLKATQAPTTQAAADSFCNYAATVMQRYPYVRKVIIGNEPNQPRFWQPIWNGSTPASPAAMEVVLASCYDKLKAFDPTLDVIGVGLSPRGNDDPGASSNSSISPVRWIKALGDAYRASGRQKPLFDEWSWHCYPNVEHRRGRDGLRVAEHRLRERRAREARALGRVQRHGPADAPGLSRSTRRARRSTATRRGCSSTRPAGRSTPRACAGYVNAENVPTVNEAKQAEDYEKLVHLANCEPTLTAFHIFHEIDESDRTGFQSGVLRVDFSERPLGARAAVLGAARDRRRQRLAAPAASGRRSAASSTRRARSCPTTRRFPYQGRSRYAATKVSGGGKYIALDAGEGFTYTIAFKNGSQTRERERRGASGRRRRLRSRRLCGRHGDDRPQGGDEPGAHDHGHAESRPRRARRQEVAEAEAEAAQEAHALITRKGHRRAGEIAKATPSA